MVTAAVVGATASANAPRASAQRTSPITHVILHAVRRMLVIGVSSALLRNRITALNWAGIVIAFTGVLGYALSQ